MVKVRTSRLIVCPMEVSEIRTLIAQTEAEDPGLAGAYREMYAGAVRFPEQYGWYAPWEILKKTDGCRIGDLCFKGMPENGRPEIGYGISAKYQGHGYATAAVAAMCAWAMRQPGVCAVEAETEPDNEASKRVLAKCGFAATGAFGKEGPRFIRRIDT